MKNWIQNAVHPSKKGALHKELGVPQGKKIPKEKLDAAAKKGGKVGQRARFAENMRGLNKPVRSVSELRARAKGK